MEARPLIDQVVIHFSTAPREQIKPRERIEQPVKVMVRPLADDYSESASLFFRPRQITSIEDIMLLCCGLKITGNIPQHLIIRSDHHPIMTVKAALRDGRNISGGRIDRGVFYKPIMYIGLNSLRGWIVNDMWGIDLLIFT